MLGFSFNKLISKLLLIEISIILFSKWNTSINESNLPFPLSLFINVIKGLSKIIEKIVPWNESVITPWEWLIPNIKFSI